VGGKVAGIKITPGVRRDAGRGVPGETQTAGRKARCEPRDARRGVTHERRPWDAGRCESRRARGMGGLWDARHGASCGTRGTSGFRFPRRMSCPPGVSGVERRRRGERDVRRCRPTLHRRARSRHGRESGGGAGPLCTDGPSLDRKGGGGRRWPSTLHRWARSSWRKRRVKRT
jgi:hypothetical protein